MKVENQPMFMFGITDGTAIEGRQQLDVQGVVFQEQFAERMCSWLNQLMKELGEEKIRFEYIPVTMDMSMAEVQQSNIISLDDRLN